MKKLYLVYPLIFLLAGCQSWGNRIGYRKAKAYYETEKKVHVPAFSYGFMRGWRYYELERARGFKNK